MKIKIIKNTARYVIFKFFSSSNFVLLMGVAKKRGYESFPVRNPYVKMSKILFVFENF